MILTTVALSALLLERRGRRRPAPSARFDAIVVLGCPVAADGRASSTLRRRALLAAELHRSGHAPCIVVTGAATRRGLISEAEAAARVLDEVGIGREHVVIEDRSLTTRDNARCTAALGDFRRVLVVSDAYHLPRALLLFGPHFEHAEGAGTMGSIVARAKGALREVPLYAAYGLAARLGGPQ